MTDIHEYMVDTSDSVTVMIEIMNDTSECMTDMTEGVTDMREGMSVYITRKHFVYIT